MFAFGVNDFHRLGTLSSNLVPKVVFPNDNKIIKASCGFGHSIFLDKDDKLYGAGATDFGQLGSNCTRAAVSPELITEIQEKNINIMKMYSGYAFNVFITNNGNTFVNGSNSR